MANDLNVPSFFRKGGLPIAEGAGAIYVEVGRNPLDGTWYVELRKNDGLRLRSIMRPEQAFAMFKGGLMAMVCFQPEKIGEMRSLLQELAPHA